MPEVTVLMPVYNGAQYVGQAIDSILNQTYSSFELLILDDGSTDGTREIISRYRDERIRLLVNPERLKLSGALNRGMLEAKGVFIARMDADDISRPNRIERQIDYLHKNPGVAVCGAWVRRFGKGRKRVDRNPVEHEAIKAYSLFECPFSHPAVVFDRAKLASAGLRYNGEYYPTEDYELWSRVVHLYPCANIPQVLLDYRINPAGMTGSEWGDMDAQGVKIGNNNLRRMGVVASQDELILHRNIGRAGGFRWQSLAQLQTARGWLEKLWQANSVSNTYDTEALSKIFDLIWFRVCYHATPLGFEVFRDFWAGPRKCRRVMPISFAGIVLLAVIRNKLAKQSPNC